MTDRASNMPGKKMDGLGTRWIRAAAAVVLVAFAAAAGACARETPADRSDLQAADLTSLSQRGVYATGFELGRNLREQGVDVDLDALIRGLTDGLDDLRPLLGDAEMHRTMADFRAMLERRQKDWLAELGERNLAAGAAFLASNAVKPGVVTLPSGLQYEVLRDSDGRRPTPPDEVTVHYEARLLDGTVWNTSYGLGRPITFTLDEVIPGWQEALSRMGEGARWRVYLPPELAYGDRSPSPLVGPNATLVFDLELLAVGKK